MSTSSRSVLVIILSWVAWRCQAGWIDPATSQDALTVLSLENLRPYELVFSDEFNTDGRTFADGDDPRWTAMNKDDYTNYALQYYNKDLVTTVNGEDTHFYPVV